MDEQELKNIWNNTPADMPDEEIGNALKKLLRRISVYERIFSQKKRITRKKYMLLKIAGIVLLPVLASFFTYLAMKDRTVVRESVVTYAEYAAPLGERRQIILPDHTEVCLNSGSVLIVPEKFIGKDRTIYLVGEGYFNVAPDKEKPFKVKTPLVEIEALGTAFSVSAYAEEPTVEVILAQGSVRLSTADSLYAQSLVMLPDHQSVYNRETNGFTVNRVNASQCTSWKEGVLIFDKTPIGDVLRRIEIQYGVEINYDKSDRHIMKHIITAKFIRNESLTDILDLLAGIIEFKYQLVNNQVLIK